MPKLTVFTPTYNRAYCLHKCYESLQRQSNHDFVWLVIDDGSTDNTKEVVEQWKETEKSFAIEYFYKENGGLHTGYNEAIRLANTELMICLDSDDYLTDDAIEGILTTWESLPADEYAGIVGLDVTEDNRVLGELPPDKTRVNLIDFLFNKYSVKDGDKKLVVRTELYKKYAPMPSFGEERNFNPHYMHLQISTEYDFFAFNKPLCVVEYEESGMSRNIFRQYCNSPLSFAQTRRLYMTLPNAPKRFLFRQCMHYVSSCILAKRYRDIFAKSPKKGWTFLAFPFGVALSFYIRRKGRAPKKKE